MFTVRKLHFPNLGSIPRRDSWWLTALTGFLFIGIFIFQFVDEESVHDSYLYIIPVLLGLWSRRYYYPVLVAGAATAASQVLHFVILHHRVSELLYINFLTGFFLLWVTALVCVLHNRAEQNVENSRTFLDSVMRASPDLHWVLDLTTRRIVFVSQAAKAMTGYNPADVVNQTFESFAERIHPDDRECYMNRIDSWLAAAKTGEDLEAEFRIRHADESWRWVRSRSRVMTVGPEGTPLLVTGTITDISHLKATERYLTESSDMLRTLIDTAPLPMFTVDTEGRVDLIWNPACERLTGWLSEDVRGDLPPIIALSGQPRYRQQIAAVLDGRQIDGIEFRVRRRGGAPLECLLFGVPAHCADGRVCGGIFMLVDQTESKRNQELIQSREREMRTLMGNLPGMVYRCRNDREWTMDFVSEGCRELTGYEPYQLLNNRHVVYNDIIHPDDRERVWEEAQAALETKSTFHILYRLATANGVTIRVSEQGQGIWSDDGTLLFLEGFITDVTELEQAQALLKQSEEKYRSLFEAESDAVILADAATLRILDANSAAPEMYGYSHTEFLRLSLPDITLEPEATRREIDSARGILKIPMQQHARKDGSLIAVELSINSFELQDRKCLLVVSRDITERQRTEEALRESQERFRNLADSAPVLIYMAGVDRHCYYFNRTWLNFTSRPLQDEYGKGWQDGVHPEDTQRLLNTYRAAFKASRPYTAEFRLRHTDGTYHWLLDYGTPRFSSNGVFVGYIGTCTDITERRRAEDNLRESEQRYRQLFERQVNGIGIVDLEERFTFVNPAAERVFGVLSGQLIGRNLTEFLDTTGAQRIKDETAKRIAGEISSYDIGIIRADGARRTLAVNSYPNYNSHGEVAGAFAIFTDITELRHAEQALRDERRIFIGGPMVVFNWRWTAEVPVEYVSPNVHEQFGYAPTDFLSGQVSYTELIHPDDKPRLVAEIEDYTQRNVLFYEQEYRLRHADGGYRWVRDFTVLVRNADNHVTHHHCYVFDVTARREAEAALRQSETRQRLIVNSTLDCVIAVAAEGRIVEFNPAAERAFGYKRDAVLGKRLVDTIIPERLRDEHIAGVKRFMATGTSSYLNRRIESIGRRADGTEFPIEISTVRNEGDNTLLFTAFIRDISERKAEEQTLVATAEHYRQIAEVVPFPMFISRMADAQLLFINADARVLFGVDGRDVSQVHSTDLYADPADRDRMIERVRTEGSVNGWDVRMKKADGTPLSASLSVRPFQLDNDAALLIAVSELPAESSAAMAARPLASHIEQLNKDVQDVLVRVKPH